MTHRAKLLVLATALNAVLLAISCRSPDRSGGRSDDPQERPGLHAIHSERLQTVMAALERLTFAELPPELDARRERQRRIEEIEEAAAQIARTATFIPDVLADVRLPPEYRQEFRDLSKDLETRARSLEKGATTATLEELQRQLEGIRSTCAACHVRFRVLPSPERGPPGKA